MALELNQSSFELEVLKFSGPVLVDFWAPWCSPCKAMGPILDTLAKEYAGRVKIAKVNVDESPDLAAKYNVQSIPFFVFFANGEVKYTHVGGMGARDMAKLIDEKLLGK